MSILEELHTLLSALGLPVETGHFTDTAPERYFVTIPLSDRFTLHADNRPGANIEEARISLFSKGSEKEDAPLPGEPAEKASESL